MSVLKRLFTCVFTLCFFLPLVSSFSFAAENSLVNDALPGDFSEQLKTYIYQLRSPLPDERIEAIKGVSGYWESRPESISYITDLLDDGEVSDSGATPGEAAEELLKQAGEKYTDLLLSYAGHGRVAVRKKIVLIIGSLNRPEAVDPLIALLKTEKNSEVRELLSKTVEDQIMSIIIGLNIRNSLSVRKDALRSLGKIENPFTNEIYLSALKLETDTSLRIIITSSLKNRRDPIVKRPFGDIVLDRNEDIKVRRNAATALGNFKEKDLIEPYIALLGERDSLLNFLGKDALQGVGLPKTVEGLISIIKTSSDAALRLEILKGLSHIDIQGITRLFSDIVKNREEGGRIRAFCFSYLSNSGKTEFLTPLLLINDPDPGVRAIAAVSLKETNLPEVYEILLKSLKNEKRPEVRESIYAGLGTYINRKTLALNLSPVTSQREAAARSLGSVGSPDAIESLALSLDSETENEVRLAIVESLVNTRDPRIVLPLIGVLRNDEEEIAVRGAAIRGLAGFSGGKVLETQVSFLQSSEPDLRRAAVVSLRENSNERVTGILIKLFRRESDNGVRFEIIENLKGIDNSRITSLLIALAKDKNEDVRIRRDAFSSLKERWEPRFREIFIPALTDGDQIIRKQAISALVSDGSTDFGDPLTDALQRENDPGNREIILQGLSKIRDPLTLKPFSEIIWGRNRPYPERILKAVKKLYSPDLVERASSADFLGKKISDNPEFINFLPGILNDNGEVVLPGRRGGELTTPARIVLRHLGRLKGIPVSLFAKVLKTGHDPVLRVQAASVLGETGNEKSAAILVDALGYEASPAVREAIAKALRKKKGSIVREAFTTILRHSDDAEAVRVIASRALADYMGPEIVRPLVDVFMKEAHPEIRANIAIRLLGADSKTLILTGAEKNRTVNPVELGRDFFAKGGQDNLSPLVDALTSHPSVAVRRNAVSVLERADPENVPEKVLLDVFKSEKDKVVRKGVLHLLALRKSRFMTVPFADIIVDDSEEPGFRRLAADALLPLKVPFVYRAFEKVLNDSDSYIRKIAVKALLSSGRSGDELVARLAEEDEAKIRKLLVKGLSTRKSKDLVLPFKKIAGDRHEDVENRRFAAGALTKLDVSGAVQVFLSLLEDPDPVLQGLAIKALIESRDPEAVDPLIRAMERDENSFMKADIARSVNGLLASLISGLESRDDPDLRSKSAVGLGKISYYVATDSLLEALPVEVDEAVKLNIVRGLAGRKSAKIAPYFKDLLFNRGEDHKVRELAGGWILENSYENLFSRFQGLLKERNRVLRGIGVTGLKKIQDERAVPVLLDLFKRERSLMVKYRIVDALTGFSSAGRDIPIFFASLFGDLSESRDLRKIAGAKLVGDKGSEAAHAFTSSLNDSNQEIRDIALKGLREIPGPEKTLSLLDSLELAKDVSVKLSFIRALSGIKDDRKIIPLLKIVHTISNPQNLRYKAAEALAGPTGEEVARAYMSFLDNKNPVFRKIAAKGLKKLKSPLAAVSLITALQVERDPEVRRLLADATGITSAPPGDPAPEKIVTDRKSTIVARRAALGELVASKRPGLSKVLYSLLTRKDNPGLQLTAARGLAGTGEGQQRLVEIIRGGGDFTIRELAAKTLVGSGYAFLKELLASLLTDSNEDSRMRKFVISLYRSRADLKSINVFRTLLEDPDPDFRLLAIEELNVLSPPDKKSLFTDLLGREKNLKNRERLSGILKGSLQKPAADKAEEVKAEFPQEVASEIRRLESDQSSERGAAALKLGEFGREYPDVIPYLLRMLGNDDAVFKIKRKKEFETTTPAREAVKGLGKIGKPVLGALFEQARTGDRLVRLYSVMAIGAITDDDVVEELIKIITVEQDPYVRREVTKVLKQYDDEKIVELFLGLVKDKSEFLFVRIDTAGYLSRRNSPEISGAMAGLLKERKKRLRYIASEYFTRNSTKGFVGVLLSAFRREPVISTKVLLAEALKLSGDPEIIPVFIEQLKRKRTGESGDEFTVRQNMMEGLMSFNDPRAFDTYIAALEDEDPEMRATAVKGLAALADPEGLPALLDRLDLENEDYVRQEIVLAISSFDEPVVVRKLVKIVKKDKDMEFRQVAIKSLGASKDPAATRALINSLKDPDIEIQAFALEALALKKDTTAVDSFIEYSETDGNDSELRQKAKQGVDSIVTPLVTDLSSADLKARKNAATRLSVIKAPLIAKPFIAALKREKGVSVRLLLLKGLKEQKEISKAGPLLAIFSNRGEKKTMRRAAVDALKGEVTVKAVNILKEGLFEKDSRLRQIVAERIAENDAPVVISLLMEAFKKEKKKKNREKIIEQLKGKTDRRLITFFSELVNDRKERSKVRINAAEGLKNQKDPSSFETFADLLMEKKASLRVRGAEGLGVLNDPLSIQMLVKLLDSEKVGKVRHSIVKVLSAFDSSEIRPVFIEIMSNDSENFKVRKIAAAYLREHRVSAALNAFVKVLNGKDSALQKIASEYLLKVRNKDLIAPFVTLLSDRDSVLRQRAVDGLMNNRDAKSLGPLIASEKAEKDPNVKKIMTGGVEQLIKYAGDILKSGKLAVRKYVAGELSKLDDPRLMDITVSALKSEKNFQVREFLTTELKKLDEPALVPVLIKIMGDSGESSVVRANAAEGLKRAFLPDIFDAFAELLKDPDPGLRSIAAEALSEYGEKKSLRLLLKAIKTEKDPQVRVTISEGLRELKDPELMTTLIAVMSNLYEDAKVRQNAASGLRYMKDKKTVKPFISVIADDDPEIRLAAVKGLSAIGDSGRVDPFVLRLSVEMKPVIRAALTEGLKGVKTLSVVPPLKKILRNDDELLKTRQNAAVTLAGFDEGVAGEVFSETVFDVDPLIRGVSATALIKEVRPEFLDSVLSLLAKEKVEDVRLRITRALKGQENPAVIPPMIAILANKEESVEIRRSAAEVLAGIKDSRVVKPLRSAMESDDNQIRISSLKGLRLNSSSRLKDAFFKGLRDGDPEVRFQATWALSDMNFLQSSGKAARVVKELNISEYLKGAVTRGVYSKMPMGKGMGIKAINTKGGEYPSTMFFLIKMLSDKSSFYAGRKKDRKLLVGELAAEGLSGMGERAVPHLMNVLMYESSDLARVNASGALLGMDVKLDSLAFFEILKKEKDLHVRTNLFRILVKKGFEGGNDYLLTAFADKDESSETRQVAGRALLKMGLPAARRLMRVAISDQLEEIRELAAEFLRKSGTDADIVFLRDGLRDQSPGVRYHSVSGLLRLKGFRSMVGYINELELPVGLKNALKRLYSDNPKIRGLAINFVGRSGSEYPSVNPFLTSLLGDETEYAIEVEGFRKIVTPAHEAEKALVKIGKPAADSLSALLKRKVSDTVRIHLVNALVEINDPETVGDLVQAFKKEKNSSIRVALSKRLMSEKNNKELNKVFLKVINDRKEHWRVRYNAVKALKGVKGAAVTDAFLFALKDKDSVIRSAATEGLIGVRNRKVLRPLIRALDDEYAVVRYNAAQALRNVRSRKLKKVYKDIVNALNDFDPVVRRKAAETLGVLKVKKSAKRLLSSLRDLDAGVRLEAAKALGLLKVSDDNSAAALLDIALTDQKAEVRAAAISSLLVTRNSKVISTVYEAFSRDKWSSRENAVAILKRLKDPRAVKYMLEALASKDRDIRLRLVEAFAYMGKEHLRAIVPLVKDESVKVRRKVAWAFGVIGSRDGMEPLKILMKDRDRQVRRTATSSLARIGGYPSLEFLLREDDDFLVRKRALEGMLVLNPGQKLLDTLYNLLTDRDVRIRRVAALGLGRVGDQFSVDHLVEALKGRWSGIRVEAAKSLGDLNDPLATEALLDVLKSGNAELRKSASVALEKITGYKGEPTLKYWKGVKKNMRVADVRESGRLFILPLAGALVILLLL